MAQARVPGLVDLARLLGYWEHSAFATSVIH